MARTNCAHHQRGNRNRHGHSATPCGQPPTWSWPASIIVIVIVVAVEVLVALGFEATAALTAVGGAGWVATDVVRRLAYACPSSGPV